MRTFFASAMLAVVGLCTASAASIAADAHRGAQVLADQKCTSCHSIDGKGKGTAPDLGRRLDRDYTPAGVASRMWNHAPTMWSAMKQQSVPIPQISEQDAADLFAYLYSTRFFEKPGDAARGKRAFTSRHCSGCHSLSGKTDGPGKPVAEWHGLNDPIVLLQRMWNHAPQMEDEFARRNVRWVPMTSQDLTDILVFVQNLPGNKPAPAEFQLGASEAGRASFEARCQQCHQGGKSLEGKLADKTLTDIAAEMWNHAPKMTQKMEKMNPEEIRNVISYVWSASYFQTNGDSGRGRRVFDSKGCAGCHEGGGAPAIGKTPGGFSAMTMVSVLWKHGPQMQERMQQKGVTWPQLSPADAANLIAFLNAK
jgi:mono/diheme cytochrome c family protein